MLPSQLDNTRKDNKNHTICAFLAWLVQSGNFHKVTISFLPVGHTHEDIHALFAVIVRFLRVVPVTYTHEELRQQVDQALLKGKRTSWHPTELPEVVRGTHDWGRWFNTEECDYFSIPLESCVCGGPYFSWDTSVFTWNTSVFTWNTSVFTWNTSVFTWSTSVFTWSTSISTLRILQYSPLPTLQYSVFTPLWFNKAPTEQDVCPGGPVPMRQMSHFALMNVPDNQRPHRFEFSQQKLSDGSEIVVMDYLWWCSSATKWNKVSEPDFNCVPNMKNIKPARLGEEKKKAVKRCKAANWACNAKKCG